MAVGQWKKYYVYLAGDTGGSHHEFLLYLNRTRQSQVFTPAESDYVLIFCPVFSEPAREVEWALVNFPGGKSVVGPNRLLQVLTRGHLFEKTSFFFFFLCQGKTPCGANLLSSLTQPGLALTCSWETHDPAGDASTGGVRPEKPNTREQPQRLLDP